jgi:hypothetical protein
MTNLQFLNACNSINSEKIEIKVVCLNYNFNKILDLYNVFCKDTNCFPFDIFSVILSDLSNKNNNDNTNNEIMNIFGYITGPLDQVKAELMKISRTSAQNKVIQTVVFFKV